MARQQLKQNNNIQCLVHTIEQKHLIQRLMQEAAYFYDSSVTENLPPKQILAFREKAKNIAYQILSIQGNNSDTLNLLARIALDEGRISRAAEFIDSAIKITPDSASYLYSQGHIFLAKQDYDNAEKSFTQAIYSSPTTTRAKSSLAYIKVQQGKYTEAFKNYRQLITDGHEDAHIKSKLFECIKNLQADSYDEELEKDLISYYQLSEVDYASLANITASLLLHKYRDLEKTTAVKLTHFVEDTLLNLALGKTYFQDISMEALIKEIRKEILLKSLQENTISDELTELTVNIAIHSFYNEYIYAYSDDENNLALYIEILITKVIQYENWQPDDIIGAFLLISMYKPIKHTALFEHLAKQSKTSWPKYAQPLVNLTLYGEHEEQLLRQSISILKPITSNSSYKVQKHYEENPYPRWLNLNYYTATDYGQALTNELPYIKLPAFFKNSTLRILIAGCGTGKHAIQVATYFRNVEVLAADISIASLAYAKKMAHKHHVTNIEFLQADIMALSSLDKKFHIIECSGVLHHMQDPLVAWRKLNQLLVTHGLIKIGLYSQLAREKLTRSQDLFQLQNKPNTLEEIILAREQVKSHIKGTDTNIFHSTDFYTCSGFRDLVLHAHELTFSILDIEQFVTQTNCEFLGFVNISDTIKNRYKKAFADDPQQLNLNYWHQFEQKHKNIFASMYQFYCQPMQNKTTISYI